MKNSYGWLIFSVVLMVPSLAQPDEKLSPKAKCALEYIKDKVDGIEVAVDGNEDALKIAAENVSDLWLLKPMAKASPYYCGIKGEGKITATGIAMILHTLRSIGCLTLTEISFALNSNNNWEITKLIHNKTANLNNVADKQTKLLKRLDVKLIDEVRSGPFSITVETRHDAKGHHKSFMEACSD